MLICGICNETENSLKDFHDYVGQSMVPIYEVILKCLRSTNCKYIENGVCYACARELGRYYDCIVSAKRIRKKFIKLLKNKNTEVYGFEDESAPTVTYRLETKVIQSDDNEEDNDTSFEEDLCEVNSIEHENNNAEESLPCSEVLSDTSEKEAPVVCRKDRTNSKKCKSHKKRLPPEFVCEICGKVLKTKRGLDSHVVLHGDDKPFKCHICGESFYLKIRLNIHLARHTGERPYKCKTCGKTFLHKWGLTNHEVLHKPEEQSHECETCKLRFPNASRLKRHQLKHTDLKTCFCKYCDVAFKTMGDIRSHLRQNKKCAAALKDDDVKLYEELFKRKFVPVKKVPIDIKCNICGKKYTQQHRLKIHMYTHAKVKDLKCPHCQYCTADKNLLYCHLKFNKKCSKLYQNES